MTKGKEYNICTRAQIVTLKLASLTVAQIKEKVALLINNRYIRLLWQKATSRGFDPKNPVLLKAHLEDSKRSGRPTVQTPEKIEEIKAAVRRDRYGREKSCVQIGMEVGVSAATVQRVLHKMGFRKTKPTRKPGLTEKQKKARYEWCRRHQGLPDEFWHNLIWTDETSVLLGQRRGGYRIWRQPWERVVKSCIRPRWKGYSEFMFWGSFSYHYKGTSIACLPACLPAIGIACLRAASVACLL
jgi:transposase